MGTASNEKRGFASLFGKKNKDTEQMSTGPEISREAVAESMVAEPGISGEVIAAIAGALAALEVGSSGSKLIIRKISRVSGSVPAWGQAGLEECIASRR